MKLILGILVVGILTLLLGWVLPWWSIGIAGLCGGLLFGESSVKSFFIAFLGVGFTWLILAFFIDQSNGGILSSKMAVLFGGIPPITLVIISALVGGVASGLTGLTGYFAKKSFGSN